MVLPFGLHWKCPHHPNGCQDAGPFAPMALACAADSTGWRLFRKVSELMKAPMKKPDQMPDASFAAAKWADADFEKEWPYLAAFLSATQWDDGTIRETGTILVFVQEGYLKCCLNDRALDRSAFVTAPSINCLFDLCEAGLETEKLDWRKRAKR